MYIIRKGLESVISFAEAMDDLNKAIELSNGKGKAAAQAYCQRAMLHQIANREKEATSNWKLAAQLGSQFAKNQLDLLNPYAALCNKMLYEAFNSLKTGNDGYKNLDCVD